MLRLYLRARLTTYHFTTLNTHSRRLIKSKCKSHIHIYIYSYTHIHIYTYTYTHIHTHTHTYTHIHTHTYTYTHIHTHTHTYTHTHTHKCPYISTPTTEHVASIFIKVIPFSYEGAYNACEVFLNNFDVVLSFLLIKWRHYRVMVVAIVAVRAVR